MQLEDHPKLPGEYGCLIEINWVGENTWRIYSLCCVLFQYFIPLIIITFCHYCMAKVLWGSKTPGQANDQRDEVILANKKKVFLIFQDSLDTTSFIMLPSLKHLCYMKLKFCQNVFMHKYIILTKFLFSGLNV